MNRTFLSVAILSSLAFPALSADFSTPLYADAPIQPVEARWSGLYAGVHAGWAGTQGKLTNVTGDVAEETDFPGALDRLSDHSYILGVTAGYNIQRGPWVFGPELELGYLSGSEIFCEDESCYNAVSYRFDNMYGLAAGRIGFATESILFYGKAGLALTKISHGGGEYDGDGEWDFDEAVYGSSVRAGLALGGGLEFALDEKTSLKGEYMYMDFGKKTYSTGTFGEGTFNARAHTIKLGVNYKF